MSAKILVVDDELDLQELVRRKFRREIRHGEFSFDFANDGVAAMEKVREDPAIDLVISDINMPRMDGLTLLEELGEFEEQLKTIIISAYGDMDNIRAAMNRGASDFVTKPIDFQDLLITIKNTLDKLDLLKEAVELRMAADRARANLARYVPPNLVDTLAAQDQPFGPPRQQDAAVLFVDIRGFTTMSEEMSPTDVMKLLRVFHERMVSTIFAHGGTLDKYIGDAVLATFGVPTPGPKDAANALACAYAMLDNLRDWNQQRLARDEQPIGVGIGLHYGPLVTGDIGSENALEFAIIGDTVNIASRLQGLTRSLETDLVVSQALAEQAKTELNGSVALLDRLADAGDQAVSGRAQKVAILKLA